MAPIVMILSKLIGIDFLAHRQQIGLGYISLEKKVMMVGVRPELIVTGSTFQAVRRLRGLRRQVVVVHISFRMV